MPHAAFCYTLFHGKEKEKRIALIMIDTSCPIHTALLFVLAGLAVSAQTPVSVTEGESVEMPYVSTNHFAVEAQTEAIAVPLTGWKIVWPLPPKEGEKAESGIRIVETNDLVRGAVTPVLRLELTHGDFPDGNHPLVELARPFNA